MKTDGPWKIRPSGGGTFDIVDEATREHVARVVFPDDARLIAAAPEMLDKLEGIVKNWENLTREQFANVMEGAMQSAAVVVRRARGDA
jgi:hypothetical protein